MVKLNNAMVSIKHLLFVVAAILLVCAACSERGKKPAGEGESDVREMKEEKGAPAAPASISGDGLPVVIDFSATWCPPCREFGPIFERVADEYEGRVKMVSIDVDENQDLARQFGVESIPMVVYISADGKIMDTTVGLISQPELEQRVNALLD